MAATWNLTVWLLMPSRSAMRRFDRPMRQQLEHLLFARRQALVRRTVRPLRQRRWQRCARAPAAAVPTRPATMPGRRQPRRRPRAMSARPRRLAARPTRAPDGGVASGLAAGRPALGEPARPATRHHDGQLLVFIGPVERLREELVARRPRARRRCSSRSSVDRRTLTDDLDVGPGCESPAGPRSAPTRPRWRLEA